MPTQKKHLIEVLGSDGRSEFFTGWNDLDEMTWPEFSDDREYATKYDLTFHREECLTDYERLCELGFDASIETITFTAPDWLTCLEREAKELHGFGWGELAPKDPKPVQTDFAPMCKDCMKRGAA